MGAAVVRVLEMSMMNPICFLRERIGFTGAEAPSVCLGRWQSWTPGAYETAVLSKHVSRWSPCEVHFSEDSFRNSTPVSDTPRNGDHKRKHPDCGGFYFKLL